MNDGLKNPADTRNAMANNPNPGNSRKEKQMNAVARTTSIAVLVAPCLAMIAGAAEPATAPAAAIHGQSIGGSRTEPWPSEIKGFVPPQPGEHPRLLFRKTDLAKLRAKLKTPEGQAIVKRLREQLNGSDGQSLPLLAIMDDPGVDMAKIKPLIEVNKKAILTQLTAGYGDGGYFKEGDGTGSMGHTVFVPALQAWKTAAGLDFYNPRPNAQWQVLRWFQQTVPAPGQTNQTWGRIVGGFTSPWAPAKDGSTILTGADGSGFAVDFSQASGAEALLVLTGPAAATGTEVLDAGGVKYSLLALGPGEPPKPHVDGQAVRIGDQRISVANGKIVLAVFNP